MPVVEYRYELRRGDEVVATGHLNREPALEVGQRVEIAGQTGIVRTVEPILGERELRLVVQIRGFHSRSRLAGDLVREMRIGGICVAFPQALLV